MQEGEEMLDNDYDSYLEYLLEKDYEHYEDEIYERLSEE